MNCLETVQIRHACCFPSWATFFNPGLQRTKGQISKHGSARFFAAAIRKSLEGFNIALLAQKNDQNYRDFGRRPSCCMVQRAWEFFRFFFSNYRIPQLNDDIEILRWRICGKKVCMITRWAEFHDEDETICYNVTYPFDILVGGFKCIVCCFCQTDPTAPSS